MWMQFGIGNGLVPLFSKMNKSPLKRLLGKIIIWIICVNQFLIAGISKISFFIICAEREKKYAHKIRIWSMRIILSPPQVSLAEDLLPNEKCIVKIWTKQKRSRQRIRMNDGTN